MKKPQELCCVQTHIKFSKESFKHILMHPRKEVETLFSCKITSLILQLFDVESMRFCYRDRKHEQKFIKTFRRKFVIDAMLITVRYFSV